MALYSIDNAIKRQGHVSVKRAGFLASWRSFSKRWLVLRPASLTIYRNAMAVDCVTRISLNGITRMERTHIPRKGHCLLIQVGGTRYILSFNSDNDLYAWHDSIYAVSPLTLFKAQENAAEVDLDDIISGYSLSNSTPSWFSPTTPSESLDKPLFRPSTHSPASSRLLLVDEEASKSTVSFHTRSFPYSHSPSHSTSTTHTRSISHSAPIPPLPIRSTERQQLRDAVDLICGIMEPRLLRKSDPGGEKPVDLVEMRLRPLTRMRRRWRQQSSNINTSNATTDAAAAATEGEEELRIFAEAMRDGYVLCQLLNTLNGNTIVRPDDRAPSGSNINITKFLASVAKLELPQPPLFLPLDLEEATGYSLARVANTIIALVKVHSPEEIRAKSPSPPIGSSRLMRSVTPPLTTTEQAHAELTVWQKTFENGTRAQMFLVAGKDTDDKDQEAPEFPDSKVYQHLIAFVAQAKPAEDTRFQAALTSLVQFLASLDLVWSLVQSTLVRIELLKICSMFNLSSSRHLRIALQKDELAMGKLLQRAISNEQTKKKLLHLRGESAQCCVDLIQDILDKGTLPQPLTSPASINSDNLTLKARRLLVKLSEASDTLPASLFIQGVLRVDKEATFGGTFGDIYRASYEEQDVALKRIRVFQRDSGRHRIRQRFCREALLWQRLQHPFVQPFFGIDAESFPTFLCMVSPWQRNGTILKHLAENGNANVEHRVLEIAQGLAYLHSQDIIHGDLRGSNILVDDGWHARLADFGLAVFSDATIATQTSHRGGSVRWMAPELHLPQSCGLEDFRRTFASDVYSFAFVSIELIQGKPPFADIIHDAAVMLRVMAKERPARPRDPESGRSLISDSLWAVVQQCWAHNIAERPTMARVVEMIKEGNEELRRAAPAFLDQIPSSKPPYQVHRASTTRKRFPVAAASNIYQSLSF
ncbi:hypothetical protein MIND_00355300 [Mycena indigotica]|uniref:Non-specific serine/threonine protein kinase n=1 Tax=Mycena indigotica TaxID=2126181 RepID=A0A8H6WEU4_9AGAR|nr:uncharacterized protein MIND_00355300 [Mycena indigotica]KAF7309834.1 hypothetical protein MIND_00355300 [Mycena indigotica]